MDVVIELGNGLQVVFTWRVTLGELVLTLTIVCLGMVHAARWYFDWLRNLNDDGQTRKGRQ